MASAYRQNPGRSGLIACSSASALIYRHIHREFPRLPKALHGYQTIVDRLLAKPPADRYQSAEALLVAVSPYG